jgi:hypothetical protein
MVPRLSYHVCCPILCREFFDAQDDLFGERIAFSIETQANIELDSA